MSTLRRLPARLFAPALIAALATIAVSMEARTSARAEEIDHAAKYEDCLKLAGVEPADAFESAQAWEVLGGGEAARHCAAVALIGLGHYVEAAERLETLAKRLDRSDPGLSIVALGQAGQAWLLAGELERAHAVQTTALDLAPGDIELLVDRAVTLAAAQNYGAALQDLDRALAYAPARPDILIYRASAHRFLDDIPAALEDVDRALVLDPDNPEGLLERGNLRRLRGDIAGARADWQRAATIAEGLPTGDAAQANIAALELGQD